MESLPETNMMRRSCLKKEFISIIRTRSWNVAICLYVVVWRWQNDGNRKSIRIVPQTDNRKNNGSSKIYNILITTRATHGSITLAWEKQSHIWREVSDPWNEVISYDMKYIQLQLYIQFTHTLTCYNSAVFKLIIR